jgi:hypothetical protein
MSSRRAPTADEVKRINQSLEALERDLNTKAATGAAAPAAATASQD